MDEQLCLFAHNIWFPSATPGIKNYRVGGLDDALWQLQIENGAPLYELIPSKQSCALYLDLPSWTCNRRCPATNSAGLQHGNNAANSWRRQHSATLRRPVFLLQELRYYVYNR